MKFGLNTNVAISETALVGKIIGRAEYIRSEPSYYVEYADMDGNPQTGWFDEQRLMIAGAPVKTADVVG